MKVYILATMNNISFAKKLLGTTKNVKIIANSFMLETDTYVNTTLKQKMESADVILAIIDDDFSKNVVLKRELQSAQALAQVNENKMLIPVIVGDTNVPTYLEGTKYITCPSDSENDLYRTQSIIEWILINKNHSVIAHNTIKKEDKSKTSYMMFLTIAIEIFAVLFTVMLFMVSPTDIERTDSESIITITLGIVFITIAFSTLFTSYLSIIRRRRQEDNEEELASYSKRLKQAIVLEEMKQEEQKGLSSKEKRKIDALGRMMINLEDIKEFYTWSQK